MRIIRDGKNRNLALSWGEYIEKVLKNQLVHLWPKISN
jgi:hypothetical protein